MCGQSDACLKGVFDYSIVFEHAPIGMCISMDGVISACNTEAGRILGCTSDELYNKPMALICRDLRKLVLLDDECNDIKQFVQSTSWQRTLRKKNGKTFLCQVTSTIFDNGTPHIRIWTFMELHQVKLSGE